MSLLSICKRLLAVSLSLQLCPHYTAFKQHLVEKPFCIQSSHYGEMDNSLGNHKCHCVARATESTPCTVRNCTAKLVVYDDLVLVRITNRRGLVTSGYSVRIRFRIISRLASSWDHFLETEFCPAQACQLSRVYRESHGFTTLLKGSRSNLTVFEAC